MFFVNKLRCSLVYSSSVCLSFIRPELTTSYYDSKCTDFLSELQILYHATKLTCTPVVLWISVYSSCSDIFGCVTYCTVTHRQCWTVCVWTLVPKVLSGSPKPYCPVDDANVWGMSSPVCGHADAQERSKFHAPLYTNYGREHAHKPHNHSTDWWWFLFDHLHSWVMDLQMTSLWDKPWFLNPLRAKCFRGNINIYLHFMSLLHIDMTQVLKVLPRVRPELTYST